MMTMLPAALTALTVLAASVSFGPSPPPPARCESTVEEGSRRCSDLIVGQVNTSAECKALCCASSAAHPVPPIPGITGPGCVAWSHTQYAQCEMCNGVDRHGRTSPPVP